MQVFPTSDRDYQQKEQVQKLKKLFRKVQVIQVNEPTNLPEFECSELNYFAKS